jgi:hypothetical protein
MMAENTKDHVPGGLATFFIYPKFYRHAGE